MDPGDDDATLERFVNFHSFLAYLMNSGMCLATSEDALRTMRRVFEESTGIQDAWVMGAAHEGKNALEKWHTWKDEFRNVPEDDGRHREECRGIAKKAADVMEALEKGMLF
ncbi:hypothetical protein VE04_06284 [Pseudogymnoascus sp. 24MN13]|nr:hypothetical protein VE04_06284 [Pseudogymnoascus sp. 24MN13]